MIKKPSAEKILVFADGASSGNPGPGGWGSIVVTPDGQVRELGGGARATTNNRMELTAVISALEALGQEKGRIEIFTDSTYVIQGSTQWIFGWRRNGWKTKEGNDVLNRDLWERLGDLLSHHKSAVDWKYVRGHSGVPGNERVDEIAVAFSQGRDISLYHGPAHAYHLSEEELSKVEGGKMSPKSRTKATAFSYLSLVGHVPMRHKTWPECENRVRGQQGAKFKKALNAEEENEILKSWGFKPSDLNR